MRVGRPVFFPVLLAGVLLKLIFVTIKPDISRFYMKTGRLFVTSVVLFSTAVACSQFKAARYGNAALPAAQVKAAQAKLDQADALEAELKDKYKLDLLHPSEPTFE